ncbi:Rieske (2Fe-2S) protein [Streptomyces sp. NPDC001922]|uniref:Rieske (2Fe-2S) protein n=1 Tax=Streptomyces sp. NPDC001922 TaxID=3364624 RepID=UPI0036A262C1
MTGTEGTSRTASRRHVVAAAGAVCFAAALTACGAGGDTEEQGAATESGGGGGGATLGSTADVPVGGGKVFAAQKVVVTQPTKGDFRAFSAVCTHQGSLLNEVSGGTVGCPLHHSRFDVADGSVKEGPATKPLPKKEIKVEGDSIKLA